MRPLASRVRWAAATGDLFRNWAMRRLPLYFTFPVIWLIYGIGTDSRRVTTDTVVVLGTLVALGLCIAGLLSIRPVFSLLGATDELLPLIAQYMHVWYWVAPLDVALWTSLASIRARGNALLESKIITAAALLNLVLDPIFIFGLFGFPRLEIQGAALATLVSTGIMLVLTMLYLHGRLRIYASPFAPIRVILDSWRHMLTIAVPAMITNAIIPISNGIVVAMIAVYGIDAVAGFGVAMRIEPIFPDSVLCPVCSFKSFLRPEHRLRPLRPATGGATRGGPFLRRLRPGAGGRGYHHRAAADRPVYRIGSDQANRTAVPVDRFVLLGRLRPGHDGKCVIQWHGQTIPGRGDFRLPRNRRVPATGLSWPLDVRPSGLVRRQPGRQPGDGPGRLHLAGPPDQGKPDR